MGRLKAYVIGAGVAGMATAVRLAMQNMDVTIFEKNNYPGGKLNLVEAGGYRFDGGPSLFVQPEDLEELFQAADENIHEFLHYTPVEIACKYFYEDGTVINAYTDKVKFSKELEDKTGEPAGAVLSYLNESKNIYEHVGDVFVNHSLHKISTFISPAVFKALISTRPSYIFSTLHDVNARKFQHSNTVQLFDRYATYNGSNPYTAAGMFQLLPNAEHNEGVFYPEGGMISIANALAKLAEKKGVTFRFNSAIQHIVKKENKAVGVVANGETFFADSIVSNVDAYFTYSRLLDDEHTAKRILNRERSNSAVVFYWGIAKEFSQLDLHNIFFSEDYEAEFDSIFRKKNLCADPTVYVNITSKCEPGIHAPVGKENWFVMINVPAGTATEDQELIATCRANILAKLSRMLKTDIESLIETERVLSPKLIEEQTGAYMGALYGSSSNSAAAAFLRHPNFSKDMKRLYFVGGTVHPGGGIPLCLKSAKITAGIIASDVRKWKQND